MVLSTIRIQAEAKLWLIIVEAALRRTFAVLVPNNLLVGEGQDMWVRVVQNQTIVVGACTRMTMYVARITESAHNQTHEAVHFPTVAYERPE